LDGNDGKGPWPEARIALDLVVKILDYYVDLVVIILDCNEQLPLQSSEMVSERMEMSQSHLLLLKIEHEMRALRQHAAGVWRNATIL